MRNAASKVPGVLTGCIVFIVAVLAGCSNSELPTDTSITVVPPLPPPEPPPPVATPQGTHGHYRGVATIAGKTYYAEGLRTEDGIVRVHVGAESPDISVILRSGAFPEFAVINPPDSWQFAGNVAVVGGEALGSGVVIGQSCEAASPGLYCSGAVAAEIRLPDADDGLNGDIRVGTGAALEVWTLEMWYWPDWYDYPARLFDIGGNYFDRLAPISQPDGLVMNATDTGELFFQSAETGCLANGLASPHLSGSYYVFDIELSIQNCDAAFGHLNNDFVGLATSAPSGAWDYDEWLVVFLATPESAPVQAAMTLIAAHQ